MKSVLWRVAKRLSYIQDARCLKVKPRERAFKQYKSPVLNVLNGKLFRILVLLCLSGAPTCFVSHDATPVLHIIVRTTSMLTFSIALQFFNC